MKKNISLKILATMIVTFSVVVPGNAHALSENQNSSINKIKLIDDMVQDPSFVREVRDYMQDVDGNDYQKKISNNQKAFRSAQKIENSFQKNKKGESIYPDYIGGLYINDDDNLVVQVVKNNIPKSTEKNFSNYKKIKEMFNDTIIVEYVNYSYGDLKTIHDSILNDVLGKVDNVFGLYVDVDENKVVVELNSYSEDAIKEFKENVMDSPMISFSQGSSYVATANVNPGAGYTSSYNQFCSYGYRAKLNTNTANVGIVSAGHCFSGVNNTINGVGTVTKHRNDGTLDAAFIETSNGVTPTNTLNSKPPFSNYTTLSTEVVNVYSGLRISKLGNKTGYTQGIVLDASYSYTNQGTTYTDLVRADLTVAKGDSGGIVFVTEVPFPQTSFVTAGIAKAEGQGSFAGQALITKATKINSTFSLSRY